ncbi:hemolymph lipopolysaccharide-binding protein isoform X2 [Anabrus simplex]|uniref:hemolymph lipopolysaccharide-binding protein isoform X2 n=1 Tax=Anabrus simplex TaxID=316456 RepID=UPI0035A3CB06
MDSMNAILNFLLLLLPLCLVNGAESETFCSAINGESFRYTVRSRRNETSHRIVSVDLQKDSAPQRKNHSTNGDVVLDVAHTYLQCSGKERITLSSVASTMELQSSASREGYELFPGLGFYKLHTKAVDWETARSICVREGGHLIVINSDVEADVVKKFFSRKPKFTGTKYNDFVFVGVHDYLKEGQYMAVTGCSKCPLSAG